MLSSITPAIHPSYILHVPTAHIILSSSCPLYWAHFFFDATYRFPWSWTTVSDEKLKRLRDRYGVEEQEWTCDAGNAYSTGLIDFDHHTCTPQLVLASSPPRHLVHSPSCSPTPAELGDANPSYRHIPFMGVVSIYRKIDPLGRLTDDMERYLWSTWPTMKKSAAHAKSGRGFVR